MTSGCIHHTKKGRKTGYADTYHKGKMQLLHRVVFCDANNIDIESIKGKVVRHTCDNPRCINPDHLLLGSHADNSRDMSERRRHGKLKLTPEQVAEIRATCVPNPVGVACPSNKFSYREFSRRFGVDCSAIRKAFLRINFSYLP